MLGYGLPGVSYTFSWASKECNSLNGEFLQLVLEQMELVNDLTQNDFYEGIQDIAQIPVSFQLHEVN